MIGEFRAWLSVVLNLVAVVAMLFGIVIPGLNIEVDGINNPTVGPIPTAQISWALAATFQEAYGTISAIF